MGFSKKHQVDADSIEGNVWVISGIGMCAPLKSVSATRSNAEIDESTFNSGSTTPTTKESRLPENLQCPPPPPPRKRRPVMPNCRRKGEVEFFNSPELDSFFEHFSNAEKAKCI